MHRLRNIHRVQEFSDWHLAIYTYNSIFNFPLVKPILIWLEKIFNFTDKSIILSPALSLGFSASVAAQMLDYEGLFSSSPMKRTNALHFGKRSMGSLGDRDDQLTIQVKIKVCKIELKFGWQFEFHIFLPRGLEIFNQISKKQCNSYNIFF